MATSKIYFNPETARTFASAGDTAFTPKNIASGNARVSAQWDRGAGAQPGLYRWFAKSKSGSAYTVGRAVQIFLSQAKDATDIPGRLGTSDATVNSGANSTRNLSPVGSIVADVTTANEALIASGTVFIYARYVSVFWLNDLGVALTNTDADHEFVLQAIPPEAQ
jgi:hypothetical protein